jgi:hypothetical protein
VTDAEWLLGPAVVLGPMALILVVVWLCLATGAHGRTVFSES